MQGFDVYFAGEIIAGQDPVEVKSRVARVFGLSGGKLDALFSGKPRRIKKNIKSEEAAKYRQAFFKAGAQVVIVPTGSKPPAPTHAPSLESEPVADAIQLLPANTGSLIDTAKPIPDFDLSSADQLSLATSDTPMQESPADPAFDWDKIEDIEVLPANTGSLEDCAEEKKTVHIPDISNIKLVK